MLLSAGIEAVLADENANILGPGIFAPGGVRLQVPDDSVERATDILAGLHEEFSPLPDDFVPPEEPAENSHELPPKLEGFSKMRQLVPLGLCILAAIGIIYALLAPLHWKHSVGDLVHMGIEASHKQDYAKAITYYNAALKLKPLSAALRFDRGLAYYRQKDYEKAVADFTEAIHNEGERNRNLSGDCYAMRGIVFMHMKKYDEALDDFNMAIELSPNDYRNYCSRARAYSQIGDADKAIKDYNVAITLDSEKPLGYNGLAWLYATWPKDGVRNGAKALELATKACELSDWKKSYCIKTLAAAEAETGNFEDAVKHAQQALTMEKSDEKTDKEMLEKIIEALADFQQQKPYRDLKQ